MGDSESDEAATEVVGQPVEGYYGEPEEVEGDADAEAVHVGIAGLSAGHFGGLWVMLVVLSQKAN